MQSNMDIRGLNNDVLLEIFAYLSPRDLSALGRSCQRFHDALKLHKENAIIINTIPDYKNYITPHGLEFLLKNIGGSVRSIKILDAVFNIETYYNVILSYCHNLQSLHLYNNLCHLRYNIKAKHILTHLLSMVESLRIEDAIEYPVDLGDLFEQPLRKLQSLHVETYEFNCSLMYAPCLKSVTVITQKLINIDRLFINSRKLKHINLTCTYFLMLSLLEITMAARAMTRAETFSLRIKQSHVEVNLLIMINLMRLKEIHMYSRYIVVDTFLTSVCLRDQLAVVELRGLQHIAIDTLRTLARMENLLKLYLNDCGLHDLHIKALYYNNFREIGLWSCTVSDPQVILGLPKKSYKLEIFRLDSISGMSAENYDQLRTNNTHIHVCQASNF